MDINLISGRVGKDAELRQAGQSQVCSFSVAANSGFGDKKQTHWYECSLWGNQGQALKPYLLKGKEVVIVGEFSEREYQGKFYKQLRVLQIDLVGGEPQQQSNAGQQQPTQAWGQQQQQAPQQFANQQPVKDDSIPF